MNDFRGFSFLLFFWFSARAQSGDCQIYGCPSGHASLVAYSLVLSSQTFCLLLYLFFFADLKLYIFCCCPFYKCSSTCLYSVWFWKHFHHDACDSFSCFALSTISYLKIRINYAVSVVLFDSIKFDFCFFWRISPFIRSRALPLRGNIDWYVHVRSYSLVLYSLHVWFTPIFFC